MSAWHQVGGRLARGSRKGRDKENVCVRVCGVQHPFTCHVVEPQKDLLSPSCVDAPEAPAHRSYCSSFKPGPQLHNTASVPGLTGPDRGTPGFSSPS